MKGSLRPHIHKLYSLEEAADSLNDLMNRKVVGKAVVVMANDVQMPSYEVAEIPQQEIKQVAQDEQSR